MRVDRTFVQPRRRRRRRRGAPRSRCHPQGVPVERRLTGSRAECGPPPPAPGPEAEAEPEPGPEPEPVSVGVRAGAGAAAGVRARGRPGPRAGVRAGAGAAAGVRAGAGPASGRGRRRQAGQAAYDGEPVGSAGPVAVEGAGPGTTHHGAQREGDDHDVVGPADDGDDVGHQVERHQQVAQQQHEPQPHAAGEVGVGGQRAQQPHDVGQQPQRLAQAARALVAAGQQPQRQDQPGPQQQETTADGDQGRPGLAHRAASRSHPGAGPTAVMSPAAGASTSPAARQRSTDGGRVTEGGRGWAGQRGWSGQRRLRRRTTTRPSSPTMTRAAPGAAARVSVVGSAGSRASKEACSGSGETGGRGSAMTMASTCST